MTHVPSAGGSKLRSNRSSIRRTSEVEVNRIPFESKFVTLYISILQGRIEDVHLSKADWIGLDGRDAQSVYRFSNHQIQANPLHSSFILEDRNHLLGFMLQIHIDVVYLYLISSISSEMILKTHATYLFISWKHASEEIDIPS
jgi:hypothetical protein